MSHTCFGYLHHNHRSAEPPTFINSLAGGVQALLPGMPPPALEGVPAPEFSRAGNGQSVSVSELPEGYNPTIDSTPPSTILNLRVVATSYEESRLTLEWTAPGDDLDSGKGNLAAEF